MGILFISITVGIVIVAIFFIIYKRRDKIISKKPVNHDVVREKESGGKKGIYD